jgi:hypothetical protein
MRDWMAARGIIGISFGKTHSMKALYSAGKIF